MTGEQGERLEGRLKFGVPGVPYSQIDTPSPLNPAELRRVLGVAKAVQDEFRRVFPKEAEQDTAPSGKTPPARSQAPQRGRQPQSRAARYPVVEGMECDECGGPVGRYPKTGRMPSDKAVCLGTCKDETDTGSFIHTVGWLDSEEQNESDGGDYQSEERDY